MITGKTIALTRQTFVGKVMSLLFNMLSRLVITFLPKSKHLLISWLQSPSAVITFKVIIDIYVPKDGFVVLDSLNFCLSEKLFISPSVLNEILAGYSNLGCRFVPFSTLNISCHSLLACGVLLKDQLLSLWGFPCMLLVPSTLLLLIFFFVFSLC